MAPAKPSYLASLRVNAWVYGISDQLAQQRINALADLLELGKEFT